MPWRITYWHDRRHGPSETDLKASRELEMRLFRCAGAARRIAIRMERCFHGELEFDEGNRSG